MPFGSLSSNKANKYCYMTRRPCSLDHRVVKQGELFIPFPFHIQTDSAKKNMSLNTRIILKSYLANTQEKVLARVCASARDNKSQASKGNLKAFKMAFQNTEMWQKVSQQMIS